MTTDRAANEARLDGIFGDLATMTEYDLIAMSSAWTGGDAALRQEAWVKVRAAEGRRDARSKLFEQSRQRLSSWVNDVGITWAGAYNRSIVVPAGVDQGNLRANAVPAILDALAATLFDTELDEDERDELLEPMRRATDPESESQPVSDPGSESEPSDD